MTILYFCGTLMLVWRYYMNNIKQENFKRIANNRVNKIVDLISKLHNLSNTSFYEYTDDQINEIFNLIQNELDKQKELFDKDKKKGQKRVEL